MDAEIQADIQEAVRILRAGGLVAFPTETVYGLGADAMSPEAVKGIFAAKGRPADHPLIVHLASMDHLADWAAHVPEAAQKLAARFWPGPLTLILPKHPQVPDVVTGGQATVGLRVPAHPVAQALLERFGGGLAAPSANRFGRISPTKAEHVRAEFGSAVFVLEGGDCEVGLESTILDLSGEAPRLLRPGAIGVAALEEVLATPLSTASRGAPRVSGSLASHYAPRTPLLLLPSEHFTEALLELATQRLAVLAWREKETGLNVAAWLTLPAEPAGYGRRLYASLRELDALGADVIAVEAVPEGEAWLAVRDRLKRAAHKEVKGDG